MAALLVEVGQPEMDEEAAVSSKVAQLELRLALSPLVVELTAAVPAQVAKAESHGLHPVECALGAVRLARPRQREELVRELRLCPVDQPYTHRKNALTC